MKKLCPKCKKRNTIKDVCQRCRRLLDTKSPYREAGIPSFYAK